MVWTVIKMRQYLNNNNGTFKFCSWNKMSRYICIMRKRVKEQKNKMAR